MFQKEVSQAERGIKTILMDHDIPLPDELEWTPVPFSGEWGIATTFLRQQPRKQKAEKILRCLCGHRKLPSWLLKIFKEQEYFPRIETVGGYP